MGNGRLGVLGNHTNHLPIEEEEDPEVEAATHLHHQGQEKIALVHPQRRVNVIKKLTM